MAGRPKHRGRVTGSGRAQEPVSDDAERPVNPVRGQRYKPGDPVGQVGRRPSSPAFLMLVGLMWVICGVIALTSLTAGWKLIPGVAFIGVGLFFIRGAATTILRHEERD